MAILDHYLRRNEDQDRVVGTLLGVRSENGQVIEVKSCFAVPHSENDEQCSLDIEYHKTMTEMHSKISRKDVVVGWYSTGTTIAKHSPLINDFYSKETGHFREIHLLVDPLLACGLDSIKTFQASPIGGVMQDQSRLGTVFAPVTNEIIPAEQEYPMSTHYMLI